MEEYSSHQTQLNGTLKEYLQNCREDYTVYVSGYYFCLKDEEQLHFFYNPKFYWDRISIEQAGEQVLTNIANECAVVTREDLQKARTKPVGYEQLEAFEMWTPRIGNYYSMLGNKILTRKSAIYLQDSHYYIDNKCSKKNIKFFDANDLRATMGYSVLTRTPNYIKSITDLRCFGNRV